MFTCDCCKREDSVDKHWSGARLCEACFDYIDALLHDIKAGFIKL